MALGELLVFVSLLGPPAWVVSPPPSLTLPAVTVAAAIGAAVIPIHAESHFAVRVYQFKYRICACQDLACIAALNGVMSRRDDVKMRRIPELEALRKDMAECLTALARRELPK